MVVAQHDRLDLVRVHLDAVERHQRLGRGLEEEAAVGEEAVPAESARREGVAGTDEGQFERHGGHPICARVVSVRACAREAGELLT